MTHENPCRDLYDWECMQRVIQILEEDWIKENDPDYVEATFVCALLKRFQKRYNIR